MAYWACARLESRREAVAQHFLKLAGYEVYIPCVREQRLRRSRRVEVISPLFPAYAFIVIEQQWHSARWSIGVAAIIMDGDHPARVPDLVIADIRAREVRGAVELPQAPGMRVGDRVRVLGGPFQGHFGLYAGMKPHERVEVLLALLGGQQRVTLPRSRIETRALQQAPNAAAVRITTPITPSTHVVPLRQRSESPPVLPPAARP
jgi:transcriptional antiterminator RfaH